MSKKNKRKRRKQKERRWKRKHNRIPVNVICDTNIWYNTDRIHSALEMSIREFNAINNNHKLVA